MIAGVELPTQFCIIKYVRRQGLKVKGIMQCNVDVNVGEVGVVQVPDNVLEKGVVTSVDGRRLIPICPTCRAQVIKR